jgi:hypothetical protein
MIDFFDNTIQISSQILCVSEIFAYTLMYRNFSLHDTIKWKTTTSIVMTEITLVNMWTFILVYLYLLKKDLETTCR